MNDNTEEEQFYNNKDSAYLRIQFISPLGFRITLNNELLASQDADTKSGEFIGAIARGLLEMAYGMGEEVYRTGTRAVWQDTLAACAEGLTEQQKIAWFSIDPIRSIH